MAEEFLELKEKLYYFGAMENFEYIQKLNLKIFVDLQCVMEESLDKHLKDFVKDNPLSDVLINNRNSSENLEDFLSVKRKMITSKKSPNPSNLRVLFTKFSLVIFSTYEEHIDIASSQITFNEKDFTIKIIFDQVVWYF